MIMTNAFTRGLRRLFGVKSAPKKPMPVDYKPVDMEEVSLQVEDKALTVTSQKKAVKKAAKKKSVKKVAKKTVKKVVKKTAVKKAVKKVAKKK